MARRLSFFLGPVLFLLILMIESTGLGEMTPVIALGAWMICWWVTEAVPIPVAALLPIIILPLTGVFTVAQACAPYASPIIFLFMGGFMIALGLERHNLHLRLALNILRVTGSSGNGIIMGFMISTALLSMWISNTATAVMMLPIATSVVTLLSEKDGFIKSEKSFALSLMLGIAYSANIGGTMTIIGTPPNVVMAGYANELLDRQIGFVEWLTLALPIGLTLIFITYLLLSKVLFRNTIKDVAGSADLVRNELNKLGKVSKEERLVIIIFGLTALGWILKPQINSLIGANLLTDHVTAMIGGILMFSMPVSFKSDTKLMDWEDTKRLPWGILLLFGGGMALAKALAAVGVIDQIGVAVQSLTGISLFLLILTVTAVVLLMTEFMSNVALVTIFIPVIIGVGNGLNVDPLLLVVPVTLASSCAFMMPISTPPNAIVYSSGYITMKEMMRAGVWLNIISIFLLAGACYFLAPVLL